MSKQTKALYAAKRTERERDVLAELLARIAFAGFWERRKLLKAVRESAAKSQGASK